MHYPIPKTNHKLIKKTLKNSSGLMQKSVKIALQSVLCYNSEKIWACNKKLVREAYEQSFKRSIQSHT